MGGETSWQFIFFQEQNCTRGTINSPHPDWQGIGRNHTLQKDGVSVALCEPCGFPGPIAGNPPGISGVPVISPHSHPSSSLLPLTPARDSGQWPLPRGSQRWRAPRKKLPCLCTVLQDQRMERARASSASLVKGERGENSRNLGKNKNQGEMPMRTPGRSGQGSCSHRADKSLGFPLLGKRQQLPAQGWTDFTLLFTPPCLYPFPQLMHGEGWPVWSYCE